MSRRHSRQTTDLLRALAADPRRWRYGYDLVREVGIHAGTLYPILMRLTDRGLLEGRWESGPPMGRPARHLYRLTVAGRHAAAELTVPSAQPRPVRGLTGIALAAVLAVLAVSACSSSGSERRTESSSAAVSSSLPAEPVAALTVTSPQFTANAAIPSDYTCTGSGSQPTIAWTGELSAAKAIAVIVDDPDAPNGTYTHLVVLDLPATATSLASPPPAGAKQGENSSGSAGWTPPCPPSGTHHYRFTVYGLSKPTGLSDGASLDDARAAIAATTVARGTLVGLVAAA